VRETFVGLRTEGKVELEHLLGDSLVHLSIDSLFNQVEEDVVLLIYVIAQNLRHPATVVGEVSMIFHSQRLFQPPDE